MLHISRIFSALATTIESTASLVATGTNLLENEANALKDSRKTDHIISSIYSRQSKIKQASADLALLEHSCLTRCSKKGNPIVSLYKQQCTQGLEILSEILDESDED